VTKTSKVRNNIFVTTTVLLMLSFETYPAPTQTKMRPFPSTGVWRHAAVIVVVFLYFSGLVLGALSEEAGIPHGMVSIIRGIVFIESDRDCDFAGNIVLGGFFSLESEDKFFTVGSHQLIAYNLMVDQINRYQCGIRLWQESGPNNTLAERNYALELRTYDDQASTDGSSAVAKMLAKDPSVDIMVGGYSSTLTQPFAETADNTGDKLVLAAGASSTKVFVDKDLTFGLLPPSTEYLTLAVEALATIHGAKTMATVWEDASFTRAACTSVPDLAEKYGMTMTSASEVVETPNSTVLDPIAESLKDEDPDVVITCVYDCQPWIQAMRWANWSPKAQVFTICVGQEGFSNQAGTDTAYIIGATPWDSSLQIKDAVTGWSASEFSSRFRRASKEDETSDVPYQAAMAASLISMLHQTIQGVNEFHQNGPQLANYISKNTFQTMGGNLAFDENGQLKAPSLTIQYDDNGVVQTVYPPEASSGPMLYPMPTWDHRDCINLSGCEREKGDLTDVFFDAGDVCDNRGMCICGDPLYFKSVGSGATANCVQSEEMNYISHSLKVSSWVLSGFLLAFCIFSLGWTYHYRENSLVKASQPLCLAFVVVGSILSILSILTTGVEGSYREDTDNIWLVDASCMATFWLWGMVRNDGSRDIIHFQYNSAYVFCSIPRISKHRVLL
jgi:branched-chain amino acid transport system substrate-binding protein